MLIDEQQCKQFCIKWLEENRHLDMNQYTLTDGTQVCGHNWKFKITPVHPAYIDVDDALYFNPISLNVMFGSWLEYDLYDIGEDYLELDEFFLRDY